MSIAIKVENLSKIYRLGEIGTGTISRDVERWFRTTVMKQEDPFLKIGQTNDRTKRGDSDIVYSLRDINFEIEQGDAVGVIGRNGAGKSTLLKILSRVTSPTTGKIHVKGRVASLLEVGTGFHPELTGRDNIYLNGAILGMRKKEIDKKLDEIIDFSGVERYIDTPVKRYSSGMYVRLAFAVASYLDSEILIIDEVLAVGDVEFQKKCLSRMNELSESNGRTLLFVSHNMNSIQGLCGKCILLENGKISYSGGVVDSISNYFSQQKTFNSKISFDQISRRGNGFARMTSVKITDFIGKEKFNFSNTESIRFHIEFIVLEKIDFVYVLIGIRNPEGNQFVTTTKRYKVPINSIDQEKVYSSIIEIGPDLRPGEYPLYFWLGNMYTHAYDVIDNKTPPLLIFSNSTFEELGYDASAQNGFFSISSNQIM